MKWIEVFLEFKKPEALSGNNGKNLVETHRIVNSSVLQNWILSLRRLEEKKLLHENCRGRGEEEVYKVKMI